MGSRWTAAVAVFLSLALHTVLFIGLRHRSLSPARVCAPELSVRSVIISTCDSADGDDQSATLAAPAAALPSIEITAPQVTDPERPVVEVKVQVVPPVTKREPMPEPATTVEPLRIEARLKEGIAIRPEYPRGARRRGEQGTVVLRLAIDDAGKVLSAKVVSSPGYRELETSAIKAVCAAQFIPAKVDGHPVATSVLLPLVFSLK